MLDYSPKESYPNTNTPEVALSRSEPEPKASARRSQTKHSLMQWFYNLSISNKIKLIPWLTFAVLGVIIGFGTWLSVTEGRTQLLHQAKAELTVTELNYNTKINQIGFGFRSQSENPVIVAAAKASVTGQPLNPALRNQVKQILLNETKARSIEYATLVGKDLRIIANANRDRQGEIFNPNNLVKEVFLFPGQLKTSTIVSGAELIKEAALLPPGLANQDILIRYTVTPIIDPATKTPIAALVSGDIVNGKLPIAEATLKAFGGGYSAVYLRKSDQDFALATTLNKEQGRFKLNVGLPDKSLLESAGKALGLPVAQRINIGNQTYTTAAKAVLDSQGKPVAILVRGTPETELNALLKDSLLLQLLLSVLGLGLIWLLATILRQAIVKPVEQLQRITRKFSKGDRQARAEVFARDEVGQLSIAFNQLADNVESNIAEIRHQEELRLEEQEQAIRQQSANAEQQRLGKELLQKRALELLIEVDPVSQGDLTIRANVTDDEIGTVADSYNATINSLRKIVTQVQVAATQMATTTSNSEISAQELSVEALRQTQEITAALNQLQEMSNSIRAVATSAEQAETAVQQSTQTVEAGAAAMNRTVAGIGAIRDTVAETSIKVKQLGESSQKISKVVKLIGTFAAQTNLLALKASIEAARAGEEGRGFAVLADEVRVLARQSAAATAEIEGLVTGIQTETNEVVAAMEAGTEQVAEGTRLVDETRQSLNQITTVSTQISALVQAITSATVTQSQASESVTHTMTDVAVIANQTSTEANHVSASFKELLAVAQELQASANQFKVS